MMKRQIGEKRRSELSMLIADRVGLHFPRERWDDLMRGLGNAAQEFGFDDVDSCADWLLTQPPTKTQVEILASHLTIGETYFFRDHATLEALAGNVLPEFIHSRRGRQQRLRIWSAACCSGEEPFSIAMLLHQILPDLSDWHITITATDINPHFLRKAASATYGEWSFRNSPEELKKRYFTEVRKGRYQLVPEIRKLVKFAHLNLVDDVYPSIETETNAMDVIFCRNVLMYFTRPQVSKVVTNLRRALVDGGWLVVSPSEASKSLFPRFDVVNFPGAIFFRKSDGIISSATDSTATASRVFATFDGSAPPSAEMPVPSTAFHEIAQEIPQPSDRTVTPELSEYSLRARTLANRGELSEALSWCDRWIAADKMNAASHYLRAVVLVETGEEEDEARASLQRAIYLDPDFILAHFALGNLARSRGDEAQAVKHFANALHLLRTCDPDELLPESEGLTAGRLAETITSTTVLSGGA